MKLEFESTVNSDSATLWNWIISKRGINSELFPLVYMTKLDIFSTITAENFEPGKVIVSSWILLFGFIPVDRLRITPVEIVEGQHFIEESPMFTMKKWRHERYVIPTQNACQVKDIIVFEPLAFKTIVSIFVKLLFRNRHKNLRKKFSIVK
ncbi:hypothetical protein [Candidatus Uabimicrobium sp. HlEnr_7]|uniref:hypothetical protein n=1 Tax=Candidatus Uabimicrobium helgolandensis TaxID=3095367 RepID=UPI003555EBDA